MDTQKEQLNQLLRDLFEDCAEGYQLDILALNIIENVHNLKKEYKKTLIFKKNKD